MTKTLANLKENEKAILRDWVHYKSQSEWYVILHSLPCRLCVTCQECTRPLLINEK